MKKYHTGIVFVHGIQGNPKQFDFLIRQVEPSVLVRNILLPGHGVTTEEFRKADAGQWITAVKKECVEMKELCEHILFVGHSMGCLLGLLVEQKLRIFSGMLLLCCPFFLRPTRRYFRNNLLASLKKGKTDDPFVNAARQANGVAAKSPVSYLFCAHPYMELLRIIRFSKGKPLSLPEKTVFCYSEQDEIVGKRSVTYTKDHLGVQTELLTHCGHNYFTAAAKDRLNDILFEMIKTYS